MTQPPDDFPQSALGDLDQGVVERLLAGESSADDVAMVERSIAMDPKRRLALQSLSRVLVSEGEVRDRDAAWARVAAQTAPPSAPALTKHIHNRPRTRPIIGWTVIAAGVVVALSVGLGIGYQRIRTPGVFPGREYATTAGQRLVVTLIDGTRVTLGPVSRLRVPAGYGRATRTTDLDGEGYFDVVHNSAHPFAVQAHGVVARDVGTAFDVRSYVGDEGVRIAVAQGQVVVGAASLRPALPSGVAMLGAGDVATVGAQGVDVQHHIDVARYTAWMQGELVFKDTPLREAVRDIGRSFGVEITVADSTLASKRVTGKFIGQSLDVVMDVITQVVGARYERNGQRVVIRPGAADARGPERGSPSPLTTVQAKETHE